LARYSVGNLSAADEYYAVQLLNFSQPSLNMQPHLLTVDFRYAGSVVGHVELTGVNMGRNAFGLTGGPVTGMRIDVSQGLYVDISGIALDTGTVNATFLRGDYDGFIRASLTGDDMITGGTQGDPLSGFEGNDTILGGGGGDTLHGNAGHDALFGEDGNDWLYGQDGDDRLGGGTGDDYLSGGHGYDRAEFTSLGRENRASSRYSEETLSGKEGFDRISGVEELKFLDGTLYIGSGSWAARAARLYEAALDRPADAAGLAYWTAALAEGRTTPQQAAAAFIGSPEFQAEYGGLGNRDFAAQLYRNLLGREENGGGLDYWTGRLNHGADRGTVLLGFADSDELVRSQGSLHWVVDQDTIVIQRGYAAILDRAADSGGLAHWLQQLDAGMTRDAMIQTFLDSAEFQARYAGLSAPGFVTQLYRNVMDRDGDAGGTAYWTDQLQSGALTRAAVAQSFAFSDELLMKVLPLLGGPELG
jgi:Ca2+-binding RTX toxin-like protein